jgi:hypothetical protein
MRAYALMQRSEGLEAAYTGSPVYIQAPTEIDAIRAVLSGTTPVSYRGIGRYPFTEYPEKDPGWQGDGPMVLDPEPHARALLLENLGAYEYEVPYPRAFLKNAEQAWEVFFGLSEKGKYELVEVCTPPDYPRDLLGFDIGYWGGGNFSIICDSAIWPVWHGPDSAALPELANVLSQLNQHGLFPTESLAEAYREWYIKQSWAEEEPSDFTVIAVGTLKVVVGYSLQQQVGCAVRH